MPKVVWITLTYNTKAVIRNCNKIFCRPSLWLCQLQMSKVNFNKEIFSPDYSSDDILLKKWKTFFNFHPDFFCVKCQILSCRINCAVIQFMFPSLEFVGKFANLTLQIFSGTSDKLKSEQKFPHKTKKKKCHYFVLLIRKSN